LKKPKDRRMQKRLELKKVKNGFKNISADGFKGSVMNKKSKLWEISKRDKVLSNLSPVEQIKFTEIYEKRVDLYIDALVLTNSMITEGECEWMMAEDTQKDINLYAQPLADLTEAKYNDIAVRNVKAVIDLVYDKYTYPDFYNCMVTVRDTERELPTTYLEAEQNLLKELEAYISNLRIAIKEAKAAK
jgi:hypothetical protein